MPSAAHADGFDDDDDEFPSDHPVPASMPRFRARWTDLQAAHGRASDDLSGIDAELEAVLQRRRACLAELAHLRDRLNRRWTDHHVRHRRRVDEPPMPPAPADAEVLRGADLRQVCLTMLRRHGAQDLRQLHGLLHRYGYRIGGRRPVQRLGDALAYEERCGRTIRLGRGRYAAADDGGGPHRIDALPEVVPLRPVRWDPPVTGAAPPPVDPPVAEDPERWTGGEQPPRGVDPDEREPLPDTGRGGPAGRGDRGGPGEPSGPPAPHPPPAPSPTHLGDDSSTNRPRAVRADGAPGGAGAGGDEVDGAWGRDTRWQRRRGLRRPWATRRRFRRWSRRPRDEPDPS